MQVRKIGGLNLTPKTNNANDQYIAKVNYNNACDTVSFGKNLNKALPLRPEINKIPDELQELIDETIKLLKTEGGKKTIQLSENESVTAEVLRGGNIRITTSTVVDDIIMTTKKGLLNIKSIGKGNEPVILGYKKTYNAFFNSILTETLKNHFLNIK